MYDLESRVVLDTHKPFPGTIKDTHIPREGHGAPKGAAEVFTIVSVATTELLVSYIKYKDTGKKIGKIQTWKTGRCCLPVCVTAGAPLCPTRRIPAF